MPTGIKRFSSLRGLSMSAIRTELNHRVKDGALAFVEAERIYQKYYDAYEMDKTLRNGKSINARYWQQLVAPMNAQLVSAKTAITNHRRHMFEPDSARARAAAAYVAYWVSYAEYIRHL